MAWHGMAWDGIEQGTIAFEPDVEVGLRLDGGDAETGFGMEMAAGIALMDPSRGLQARVRAHGLLTHENSDFRERGLVGSLAWKPNPASQRGLRMSLSQTMGVSATQGVDALLRSDAVQRFNATGHDALDRHSWEATLSYGMHVLGGGFTGTPHVGYGFSDTQRRIRMGWRLGGPKARNLGFSMQVEGSRQDVTSEKSEPEHDIRFKVQMRW